MFDYGPLPLLQYGLPLKKCLRKEVQKRLVFGFKTVSSGIPTPSKLCSLSTLFTVRARMIFESGKHFSELGQLFDDAETAANIEERIRAAKEKFITIADMEEEAFQYLAENIPT